MADHSIWYRIGYALEQARSASSPSRLRSLAGRLQNRPKEKDETAPSKRPERNGAGGNGDDGVEALLVAGGGALVARALDWWEPRRRPGVSGLLKAGAAGAGAALLRELVHPLLHGELRAPELGPDLTDDLLAGVARGLVYASLVEPRLPGPDVARGLLFGTAEYAVSPWGGLTALMGRRAPHRRLPLVSRLFDDHRADEDTFVDHVAYAVALAVLYGLMSGPEDEDGVADEG